MPYYNTKYLVVVRNFIEAIYPINRLCLWVVIIIDAEIGYDYVFLTKCANCIIYVFVKTFCGFVSKKNYKNRLYLKEIISFPENPIEKSSKFVLGFCN